MRYYILFITVLSWILIFFFSCEHEKNGDLTGSDGYLCASDAVWSHEEGDLQNTKRATDARIKDCVTGPITQPTVKWSFRLGGPGTAAAPVIGDDGTIYIVGEYPGEATGAGLRNSGLMAISPSGSLKWFFSVPFDFGFVADVTYSESVAMGKDGTIYFSWYDSTLYALEPNGKVKWRKSQTYSYDCCRQLLGPAIGSNGMIYAGSDTIVCYLPNGNIVWKFNADTLGYCQRIILGKDLIYCSFQSKGILALDYSGHQKWFYSTYILNPSRAGIIADEDDNIYFKQDSYILLSVSSAGQLRWGIGRSGQSEPALRGDYLYFLDGNALHRVDKDCGNRDTVLIYTPLDFTGTTSPLIDDNGTIYVVSRFFPSLGVMAISKEGTQLWSLTLPQNSQSGSWGPLGLSRDGTLYIPTYDEIPEDPPAVSSLFAIK